jgi:hypothetical protein
VDAFIERQRLDRVHVLKADVEGHEMPVFQGAVDSLKRRLIDIVFFEFGIHQIQSRNYFIDFFNFFAEFGYRMMVVENGALRPIDHYSFEFENLSRLYSMVAVKA